MAMQTQRWILLTFGLLLGGSFLGCAGTPPPPRSTDQSSAPTSEAAMSPRQPAGPITAAPSPPSPAAVMASPGADVPTSIASAPKARRDEQEIAGDGAQTERPGLATQFGEDLQRTARHTRFERESMTVPFVTATIWYNDAAGAAAMTQSARNRSGDRAEIELFNGGLAVGITDEWFSVLRGFIADARPYAIGEANARYAIRIVNRTDVAFEIVASVDGLSVIDGRPASLERRGYIIAPRDSMTIEGYRTSESTIAAFRFGKVSEAYSAQMGHGDRNVGVIGIAFFQERGKVPVFPVEDTRLRQDANPFPGEYAPRPKGR